MFGRSGRHPSAIPGAGGADGPATPQVGIGAVVIVVPDDGSGRWPGEPIGVVIAPARGSFYGHSGTPRSRRWMVAFDGPTPASPDGPAVERADLPEAWLRVADGTTIADDDLPPELRDA